MTPVPKITLTLLLYRETAEAVLVAPENESRTVWLPRAPIEIAPERSVAPAGRHHRQALARLMITMPRKLAEDKGLLAGVHLEGQGRLL